MNRNQRLNLNGIFGFNKLLVGKTDVEPKIIDNSKDITYIYNNVSTSLQNQISATVQNALNASEIITTFNSTLSNFQTGLSNLTTKEANDVSNLQGQINSNYTTLDNKYDQKVNALTTKQTNLQSQITALATQQTNSTLGLSDANTWSAIQTFTNGLTVQTAGVISLLRNTTIGSTSAQTLTINASPTLKSGLVVESGSVSFPSKSIDASCINNLPLGVQLSNANRWSKLQTFDDGLIAYNINTTGSLHISGDTTLGTSDNNFITINAKPKFTSTPEFNTGLNVLSGPVSFPTRSISASCITGGLSLSEENTWTRKQTFEGDFAVNGDNTVIRSESITLGTLRGQMNVMSPTTFNAAVSFPSKSIDASCINNLPLGVQLSNANRWSKLQTFDDGLIAYNINTTGSLHISGDTTLGTSDNNFITINAKPKFTSTPDFNKGLNVITGPVSFPSQSISASCITGLLSLSEENTWTRKQTFEGNFTVNGEFTDIKSPFITLGTLRGQMNVMSPTTFNAGVYLPSNALVTENVRGLKTQLTNIESSITTQVAKEASDVANLQLQINTLSLAQNSSAVGQTIVISLSSQLADRDLAEITSTISRPNDYAQLALVNCGHRNIGITSNSRWMVTMQIKYDGFESTAKNTNHVEVSARTFYSSAYSWYTWKTTHFVNFNNLYTHVTDTFPITFGTNMYLIIDAHTLTDPPTGQSYKIHSIVLQFTRIA